MANAEYTKHLRKAAKAMNIALHLQRISEAEYERRYGENPSDVDDDMWIDSTSGACGDVDENITWKQVDDGAHNYAGLPRYQENQLIVSTSEGLRKPLKPQSNQLANSALISQKTN
jgi:hypothetical protein